MMLLIIWLKKLESFVINNMLIINTASDSEYFIKLLSLLGSIKKNDNKDRKIRVWDIGLEKEQLNLLKNISNVTVEKIPHFMDNWQACYAWKIYILKHIPEENIFYMDTGMSVLRSLDCIENIIKEKDCFVVPQGTLLKQSTPKEFWSELEIDEKQFENSEQLAAGLFGFKKTLENNKMIDEVYKFTLKGYTMGYSKQDMWRDKYNIGLQRVCDIFRQDQTLLNLIFRKFKGEPIFENSNIFINPKFLNDDTQVICYHRAILRKYIFHLFLKERLSFKFKLIIYAFKKKLLNQ